MLVSDFLGVVKVWLGGFGLEFSPGLGLGSLLGRAIFEDRVTFGQG